MKSIKVVYFPVPNLGDVLSPFIVHKLSGLKVCPRDSYGQKHQLLRCAARFIAFPLLGRFAKWKRVQMPYDRPLLAVGSILSWGNPHSVVWGAGFMSENERFHGGTVYAVRGGAKLYFVNTTGLCWPQTRVWRPSSADASDHCPRGGTKYGRHNPPLVGNRFLP